MGNGIGGKKALTNRVGTEKYWKVPGQNVANITNGSCQTHTLFFFFPSKKIQKVSFMLHILTWKPTLLVRALFTIYLSVFVVFCILQILKDYPQKIRKKAFLQKSLLYVRVIKWPVVKYY